jgi:hypothetical protein
VSGHVADRLSAYLDAELPALERQAVDAHLRDCPDCARHLEELAAVDDAARRLPVPEPEGYFDAFPGRLRERLAAQPRPARPPAFTLPAWTWAAAAALLVAVIAPIALRRGPRPAAAPEPGYPAPAAAEAGLPEGVPSPVPPAQGRAAGPRSERQPVSPPAAAFAQAPKDEARDQAAGHFEAGRASSLEKKRDDARGALAGRLEPQGAAPSRPEAPKPTEDAATTREDRRANEAKQGTLSPEQEEQLRALGYAGPAGGQAPEVHASTPEPLGQSQVATRSAPGVVAAVPTPREPPRAPAPAAPPPTTLAEHKDDRARAAGGKRESAPAKSARKEGADAFAGAEADELKAAPEAEYRPVTAEPRSALEARALRQRWLRYASDGTDARADAARFQAILAAAAAYRLSGLPADLEVLRADARAYLARPDALRKERVRELLRQVED